MTSYREQMAEQDMIDGHSYSCAYAAGGDCTCGAWGDYDPDGFLYEAPRSREEAIDHMVDDMAYLGEAETEISF